MYCWPTWCQFRHAIAGRYRIETRSAFQHSDAAAHPRNHSQTPRKGRDMNKTILRGLSTAAIIAGAMAFGGAAFAGECPTARITADGKGQADQSVAAKDVTDTVLASIDLSKEMVAAKDRQFRMRRLEVQPGGV